MADLFTTADVSKLRALGWPRLKEQPESLRDAPVADWRLLDALNKVAKHHRFLRQEYGDGGFPGYQGFMNDIRGSAKDVKKLALAFNVFADRHDKVFEIYDAEGELTALRIAIDAMVTKSIGLNDKVRSRHDPKINALSTAAKKLIRLWALDAGEPPTPTQGTKPYIAGKCIHYVLTRLQQDCGGSLGDMALERLYKNARATHNKQWRNAKTGK
jgi:hypothetical protein